MAWFRKNSLITGLVIISLSLIAIPIILATEIQHQKRHFRTVRENLFYRSGQMTLEGLGRTSHDLQIRTVVSLRDGSNPGDPPPDLDEENWCHENGLNYLRLRPMAWEGTENKPAPVEPNVKKYLELLRDERNYPILLHCFAGIHRTGTYTAIYRMEVEGWPLDRAMNEMRACGYTHIEGDKDLLGFLLQYKPGNRADGLPKTLRRESLLLPVSGLVHGIR